MIFEETDKRTGKKFIVGSKYWPDGARFRHRNIKTTERYVKFVSGHASQRVIEAQRLEELEVVAFHRRQIGDIEEAKSGVSVIH
jgi:hypothetical protein